MFFALEAAPRYPWPGNGDWARGRQLSRAHDIIKLRMKKLGAMTTALGDALAISLMFVAAAVAVNAALPGLGRTLSAGPPGAVRTTGRGVEAELQDELHNQLNRIRRSRNLPALQREPKLTEIARRHSRDMIKNGFFAHHNLRGESSADRVAEDHRRLVGLVGENLWGGSKYDFVDVPSLATRIVNDLMKSSGHRENILKRDYTHLGIGAVMRGEEIRVTQVFAAVDGLLRRDLPERVRRSQALDLRMNAIGRAGPAVRVDFESMRGKQALGPFPIGSASAPSAPGRYRLRFYFPSERRQVLKIVYGPAIEVR